MRHLFASVFQRLRARGSRLMHRARFLLSIRRIHGPARLDTTADDVIVVALVRDGAYYLDVFLAHYRDLGVRHFVFVDNGSTDDTLDRLRREDGVIILQSTLPWGLFENDFRQYAATRYCRDRWCLFADMDELFDFEGRSRIGLHGLTNYLRANGHTALLAQMLEMFPKAALRDVADLPYDRAVAQFVHCDLGHVQRHAYHDPDIGFAYYLRSNSLPAAASEPGPSNRPQILFGGVRGKVFGEYCCLSKHPLVHVSGPAQPGIHPHCAAHVRVADITGLIRHYKFANNSLARDQNSVSTAATSHGEDRLRATQMQRQPDLTLWSPEARQNADIDDLIDAGFLLTSAAYQAELTKGAS